MTLQYYSGKMEKGSINNSIIRGRNYKSSFSNSMIQEVLLFLQSMLKHEKKQNFLTHALPRSQLLKHSLTTRCTKAYSRRRDIQVQETEGEGGK